MRKKLLFAAYSLDIGGIETALVTLINELVKSDKYDITLVLEKKQGIFLEELDSKIKIIEYSPSYNKVKIFAKICNVINRIKFSMKYKNKFDCSISYATYSLPGSFIARTASNNPILWVHGEYMLVYDNDKEKYEEFFRNIKADKFKKIIFVSNSSRMNFEKTIGNTMKNERITINNLIDFRQIVEKSNEKITDLEKDDRTTFLYVGRLTEYDKKISRLIKACVILKQCNYKFRVIIIGNGKDESFYKNMVEDNNLSDEVIFLGSKKNPYPYFRISDCLVLTSEYEGFPVVYNEARILNTPIITTDVSDSKEIIDKKYGIVVDKDENKIATYMKEFIEKGFCTTQKFDAEIYNKELFDKIDEIINS